MQIWRYAGQGGNVFCLVPKAPGTEAERLLLQAELLPGQLLWKVSPVIDHLGLLAIAMFGQKGRQHGLTWRHHQCSLLAAGGDPLAIEAPLLTGRRLLLAGPPPGADTRVGDQDHRSLPGQMSVAQVVEVDQVRPP